MLPLKERQQKEIARFQIHTKTGREKFLTEIAEAWAQLAPAKFAFFKAGLANLNAIAKHDDGHYDTKSGKVFVRFRIPTELWQFIRRWVPDFGDDSKDIDLLKKVFGDFARVGRDHRRHTRLFKDSRLHDGIQRKDSTGPA